MKCRFYLPLLCLTALSGHHLAHAADSDLSAIDSPSYLQITAIDSLAGGAETCDVKNKIFSFKPTDKNYRTDLCRNSKVETFMVSNAGTVQFYTIDRITGFELEALGTYADYNYELGKSRPTLRYYPRNPYGFTYIMAEEITGIDPAVFIRWNEASALLSQLKAQVTQLEVSRQTVPTALRENIRVLEIELLALQRKIRETRRF